MTETMPAAAPAGFLARLGVSVASLPPGAFAFVMATGIVSNALDRIGWAVPSVILAAIAVGGLVALVVAILWRLAAVPERVAADAGNPATAFGFLTIVAAFDVVSVRLNGLGFIVASEVLVVVGAILWLFLAYGIPARLILRRSGESAINSADGSWFLWVVSTQSVATAVGTIANANHEEFLAALTIAFWSIGVVLYLMLATLIMLRLLMAAPSGASLNPSYWIYMGATAITVLAGSMVISLPDELAVVDVTKPVVAGLTFVLWAFGLWWIPLLVLFELWRHIAGRAPWRYMTPLWSIVFPLGMVSVASMRFGDVEKLYLMHDIGAIGTVVAFCAWLVVTAAMVATAIAWFRRRDE